MFVDPLDFGVPPQIFALKNLQKLWLEYLAISKLSDRFGDLTQLRSIHVSNNPRLDSVSPQVANLTDLEGEGTIMITIKRNQLSLLPVDFW